MKRWFHKWGHLLDQQRQKGCMEWGYHRPKWSTLNLHWPHPNYTTPHTTTLNAIKQLESHSYQDWAILNRKDKPNSITSTPNTWNPDKHRCCLKTSDSTEAGVRHFCMSTQHCIWVGRLTRDGSLSDPSLSMSPRWV